MTRSRTATRLLAALPLTLALVVAPTSLAGAQPWPDTIPLPTGSLPEGIADGPGQTVYAGARRDGAIYQADVRTGEGRIVVPGEQGRAAVGMQYDRRTGLLWVAGGGPLAGRGTGTVTAYSGSERVYDATVDDAGFLNDLVVTRDAVYVTDSGRAALVVVPLDRGGRPAGTPERLAISGDYVQPAGFGANGIRELPGGELLLVSGGVLYRVSPETGAARVVEQTGERRLSGGDGLVLQGSTLYVVNGFGGDEVVVLRLGPRAEGTRLVGVLTDPDLDRPTTATLVAGRLYVVNGRFARGDSPDIPYWITQLPSR